MRIILSTPKLRWVKACIDELVEEEMGSGTQVDQDDFKAAVEIFKNRLEIVEAEIKQSKQSKEAQAAELFEAARVQKAIMTIPGHCALSAVSVRHTSFRCPGKRSKEGGDGFEYPTRFGRGIEWPPLTIEVGYSEPLSQLRIDAEW